MNAPLSADMRRILRGQAQFRWLGPQLAAITPSYIEATLLGAMTGAHVQQWWLFDMMLKTWPELLQCYSELIEGVLRKKLIYEPYHEEDEKPTDSAIEKMKVVSCALERMEPDPTQDDQAIEGTIKDILDGWFRGIAVSEVVWTRVDDESVGTIIAPKSTFAVDATNYAFSNEGVLGLRSDKRNPSNVWPYSTTSLQPQPSDLAQFPPNKFLIALHKTSAGGVVAGALLRPLAWWWCASNFCSDWLLNLGQVFGLPFRWATFDPNMPSDVLANLDAMLQNMGSAGWARFPIGTTLDFKDGGSNGSDHTPQGELLDRADRYARSLILGQTMTGTHGTTGKGGGQAFGQVEKDVKSDRIDAAGKFAAGVINQQLVKFILQLNYGETSEAPQVRFLEDEEAGLTEAQRDKTLIDMGLPVSINYLRKKYGQPEPEDEEDTIGGSQPMNQNDFQGFQYDQGFNQDQQDQHPTDNQDIKASEMRSPQSLDISVVDNEIVQTYKRLIESGQDVLPVVLKPDGKRIKDGNHRAAAFKLLGRDVPCVSGDQIGHPFRGNQHVKVGDYVQTPHGRGMIVAPDGPNSSFVSVGGRIRSVQHSDMKKIPYDHSRFPSIRQSDEDTRRRELNSQLHSKLVKISEIQDDALFASELKKLTEAK